MWSTPRLSKNRRGKYQRYCKKGHQVTFHDNIDIHSRRLIPELPGDGVKWISKIESHCANINCSDKSRYDRNFQQVTHKGVESAMNYIKIPQNAQALSVSVGNNYPEDKLMHMFIDNFHQGGEYFARIAIHRQS